MTSLPPSEVMVLRGLRRTAVIILLLMRLQGAPVSAREISSILDIDYETTRRYLSDLSRVGIVSQSSAGWILLQGGSQLILPGTNAEIPRSISGKPRSPSTTSSFNFDDPLIAVEEVEELNKRGKTALEALADYSISPTKQVKDLVRSHEYITAAYIHSHADRLVRENRFSSGLLLTVLRCGDPLPLSESEKLQRSFKKFVTNDD